MDIRIRKTTVSYFGILLLLLAMYSIGTISAIMVSWAFTLMLLFGSTAMLGANYALNPHMPVTKTVVCALVLTFLCGIGIFYGRFETMFIFYVLCTLILMFAGAMDIDSVHGSVRGLYGRW